MCFTSMKQEEEEISPFTPPGLLSGPQSREGLSRGKVKKMKKLVVFLLCLVLLTVYTDANPIITEDSAKQLLRSKRQEPPMKAGHPDEPMREHLLHMQALDQRAQEINMENWLNPHCYPRCDRNYGYPV
ncbi:uncharacterized protein C17orf67 homolog isoform X2 [Notolabrus celidotus]|uniref:uncharacterized protein C17orf67 homolog isoform X2 n=1 Tax=Notolabrus celidotus TaxID=1203425 RepID=UPI00148FB0DE|nr:uncharacterized protein C17orf67 homolog isoform X2 [Notolabrus celidotus]